MLTVNKTTDKIISTISDILGDDVEDDIEITVDSSLTDIGLNSLMLARLIVNLEEEFGHDPFSDGSHSIVDVHTVGDLVDAYAEEKRNDG